MKDSASTSLTEFVSRYSSRRKSRGIARLREVGLLRIFEGFRLSAIRKRTFAFIRGPHTMSLFHKQHSRVVVTLEESSVRDLLKMDILLESAPFLHSITHISIYNNSMFSLHNLSPSPSSTSSKQQSHPPQDY